MVLLPTLANNGENVLIGIFPSFFFYHFFLPGHKIQKKWLFCLAIACRSFHPLAGDLFAGSDISLWECNKSYLSLFSRSAFLPFRFKRTSGTTECRDIHVCLSLLRWDFFLTVWDDFTAGSCLTKNDKATLMTRMDAGRFWKAFFCSFFFQQPLSSISLPLNWLSVF